MLEDERAQGLAEGILDKARQQILIGMWSHRFYAVQPLPDDI
jgi:hypothetical protein